MAFTKSTAVCIHIMHLPHAFEPEIPELPPVRTEPPELITKLHSLDETLPGDSTDLRQVAPLPIVKCNSEADFSDTEPGYQ